MKFTLHVFAEIGLGVQFDWETNTTYNNADGHKLSLKEALITVLTRSLLIATVPKLVWRLPFSFFRSTELGYNALGEHLRNLLENERKLLPENKIQNLLASLAKHQDSHDSEYGNLSDQDIIGNIFIFLLAGHETKYYSIYI